MHQSVQSTHICRQIAFLAANVSGIEIRLTLNLDRPPCAEVVRMNLAALYLGDKHDDLVPGRWLTLVTFYINDFDDWLAARRELAHQALLDSYENLSLLDARMARANQS